jgi:hypothetical protein
MNKLEAPYPQKIVAFFKWLLRQPEPVRDLLLKEIYPDMKEPVFLFHYLLTDRIPFFAPAIIKYIAESKGMTVSSDDHRVIVIAKGVKFMVLITVWDDPDISADRLLHIVKSSIHHGTETYLNMPKKLFEVICDCYIPELREIKHQK